MRKSVSLAASLVLFLGLRLFSQDGPPVTLNSAHVRTIRSEIVKGMEYELCIALPSGYEKTAAKYPVVYMLDAYEIFGLQLQTYQQLAVFETVPPLILVGINYRFEGKTFYGGLKDYLYIRSRDFTPTLLSLEQIIEKHGKDFSEVVPVSGGGERFFRFLREELFPFVESEYRADPDDRGILGYSLGGLFSTYALFEDPRAFKRYFIGSPFLAWDEQAVFEFYKRSKFDGLKRPVKVYLSVGELEGKGMHHSWEKLKGFLEQTAHPNIQLQAEMLNGERHLTGIGAAHSRAFWRLYGDTPK